jgi:hypothetical protein
MWRISIDLNEIMSSSPPSTTRDDEVVQAIVPSLKQCQRTSNPPIGASLPLPKSYDWPVWVTSQGQLRRRFKRLIIVMPGQFRLTARTPHMPRTPGSASVRHAEVDYPEAAPGDHTNGA